MGGRGILRIGLAVCAIAIPACAEAQVTSGQGALAAGISQARAGNFANALVSLNEAVSQLASRPDESATLARTHAYRAMAFMGLEQPEWARAAALEALKADPGFVVDAKEFGAPVVALFEGARRAAHDPEAAGQAAEAAGRFQDAFLAYLSAIQSLPEPPSAADDRRLRERIITVVQKLDRRPAVPEDAKARLTKADALLDADPVPGATSDVAAGQAAVELRKAIRIAPWWPDPIVKLAMALQRADHPDEALLNLDLYQLAAPDGDAGGSRARGESAERITSAQPDARAAAPAVIYVYFPHAARGVGLHPKVTCDGQHVANLGNGRFVTLTAAPGFHTLEAKGKKAAASFEGGTEQYLRVGIEGYPAHFALRITEPGQAAAEMREKQVAPNDPKNTFSAECAAAAPAPRQVK